MCAVHSLLLNGHYPKAAFVDHVTTIDRITFLQSFCSIKVVFILSLYSLSRKMGWMAQLLRCETSSLESLRSGFRDLGSIPGQDKIMNVYRSPTIK